MAKLAKKMKRKKANLEEIIDETGSDSDDCRHEHGWTLAKNYSKQNIIGAG